MARSPHQRPEGVHGALEIDRPRKPTGLAGEQSFGEEPSARLSEG